jgi:hypothetical protein
VSGQPSGVRSVHCHCSRGHQLAMTDRRLSRTKESRKNSFRRVPGWHFSVGFRDVVYSGPSPNLYSPLTCCCFGCHDHLELANFGDGKATSVVHVLYSVIKLQENSTDVRAPFVRVGTNGRKSLRGSIFGHLYTPVYAIILALNSPLPSLLIKICAIKQ